MERHSFILALVLLALLFPGFRRILIETVWPVVAAIGTVLLFIGARQR